MTITCADCGKTQTIPPLRAGATADCIRCDRELGHHSHLGHDLSLVCAIAVFILIPPAVFLPLMDSNFRDILFEESKLVSSVGVIYREVWFPFAFGFLFFAFLFPWLRALLQIVVLGSLRFGVSIPQRGRLFRWSEELRIWSMTEVVVIAGIVTYYRAEIPAQVEVRVGAISYVIVAVLAFIGERALGRREVWDKIYPDHVGPVRRDWLSCEVCEMVVKLRRSGDQCPRCGGTLDSRVVKRFAPALAAVAAAIPLSIPAYNASVMINDQLTGVLEHTVLGTVQLLADRGYWQFGVVVLFAGVVIPVVEIVGMAWLLARVKFPKKEGLVLRTRVYRVLHRLVRWPMVIPFIAALAAPIVDYRGIDDIVAGTGATPLFLLIALLMLAVRLYEPRLMWKTAGEAQ